MEFFNNSVFDSLSIYILETKSFFIYKHLRHISKYFLNKITTYHINNTFVEFWWNNTIINNEGCAWLSIQYLKYSVETSNIIFSDTIIDTLKYTKMTITSFNYYNYILDKLLARKGLIRLSIHNNTTKITCLLINMALWCLKAHNNFKRYDFLVRDIFRDYDINKNLVTLTYFLKESKTELYKYLFLRDRLYEIIKNKLSTCGLLLSDIFY